ncbi:hypothetical protein RYZ26_08725 [Terasakiella sp. A23]|uniref:hypothetical protein n=1 Tax=Terasakiella sp. FCG-A23 TaxID=3080561 RepID=UPI0029553467|nr:hypothetical protein [Terasakiella sp. A23]MDV7339674.1 hypothetical protein [Terasakiella sp. A23]
MTLIFIKIIVTVAIVLGLSVIAERVSPRWAGLLGGYPLSVAIVLIFIGVQEGEAFAAESAVHTLAGLAANLSIFATYGAVLSYRPQTHWILTILAGLTAFFAVGIGLSTIEFDLITASIFITCVITFCIFSFKRFAEIQITQAVQLSFRVAFVRAASACFVVLAITGLAKQMGPQMAGVMASFPATVFPMIVIVHVTYGAAPVLATIKHFPIGLGATCIFCLVYTLILQDQGMLWGTVICFAISTIYLLGFSTLQQKMRRT